MPDMGKERLGSKPEQGFSRPVEKGLGLVGLNGLLAETPTSRVKQ